MLSSINILSGTTTAIGVGMMTETDTQVGTGVQRVLGPALKKLGAYGKLQSLTLFTFCPWC